MFAEPFQLAMGFVTGLAFGFLLQKGRAARFHVIVGQLLLRDWTVVKIMATAVAVGTVGVHLLVDQGLASLHLKEAVLGRIFPGALLFGAGLAVLGLCPGTCVAACGQGDRDAWAGVAGMFSGALLYVVLFPWLHGFFEASGSWGKTTLAEVLGTPALLLALGVAALVALLAGLLRLRKHVPLHLAGGHR